MITGRADSAPVESQYPWAVTLPRPTLTSTKLD